MRVLEVFATFFYLGLVSFGGGMANLPEMARILVAKGWVTPQQFADGFALGQFVPGPNMLAVVFYGLSAGGLGGALAALAGMFLPGATGALLLVQVWEKMARARWSRALRRTLIPISVGLALSTLLVLAQVGLGGPGSLLLMGMAALLIHRGASPLGVLLVGGGLGLVASWL
ncbi:chromate transporter [Thermus sp.]|uniref:chromate transporter n=1 Tax=Thermus sp. TaxID=275 RepID=UPI00307E7FF8